MSIDSYSLRRFLRMIVAPVISIGVVGYFTYHLIHGNRGLLALWQLNHEISQAELVLTQTGEAKAEMERKVFLLRPENLDPDMLEERARQILNLSRDGEIVVMQPE